MFNAIAPSYGYYQVSSLYQCFECELNNTSHDEQRSTMEMRWVLLPYLYFQHHLGGIDRAAAVFYRRLAFLVSSEGVL